jgi:hypothetical protein
MLVNIGASNASAGSARGWGPARLGEAGSPQSNQVC